ncbi:uncharacterized protein LOC129598060 [Paramacrobiotus metropolitanus]|uniref:uncharacterized protein LOC129598060 n=1 Tax=Paramacrobiotus metropolitanus TaxID=2943436 RepID=UPI0024462C8F|nr:uncharacterized protein LOC129598060 [Paramacrobiotus metropolitanus]
MTALLLTLTVCIYGAVMAAPSPRAPSITPHTALEDGHNVTMVVIPHGQSYTVLCAPSKPAVTTTATSAGRRRHRRRAVRNQPRLSSATSTALPANNSTSDPRPIVILEKAMYTKARCPTTDAMNDVQRVCAFGDSSCVIRANDTATQAGCRQRPLTLKYACDVLTIHPMVSYGMIVNNMFD